MKTIWIIVGCLLLGAGMVKAQSPITVRGEDDGRGVRAEVNLVDRSLWESYLHMWSERPTTAIIMHVAAIGLTWAGLELYDEAKSSEDTEDSSAPIIPPNTTISGDTVVIIGGDVSAPVTVRPDYSSTEAGGE